MPSWKNPPPVSGGIDVPRRGVVHRAASTEIFRLEQLATDPALSRYVEHYWVVEWSGLAEPRTSQTIPYPSVHLTIEDGTDGRRHGHRLPATLLHGVVTGRFVVELSGDGIVVGAKFRPGAAAEAFGLDASALTGRAERAAVVLPRVPRLQLDVLAATDDAARTAILDRYLLATVREPSMVYLQLAELIRQMSADDTITRVEHVVERSGWSERTVQRVFRQYVGVPAKWVLRRYRIQDAAYALEADSDVDLADLAATLGWYDQAHFTNDFRDTLGVTPADYRAGLPDAATP